MEVEVSGLLSIDLKLELLILSCFLNKEAYFFMGSTLFDARPSDALRNKKKSFNFHFLWAFREEDEIADTDDVKLGFEVEDGFFEFCW